jgi:SAM-dependent methyltransferase
MSTRHTDTDALREQVRARYAAAATKVTSGDCGCGQPADCGCDSGCCGGVATAEVPGFGAELYAALDRDQLPDTALLASLGCGNPTAVAELHEGETVLDLGSGGGIDVLLSAKRVGPSGKAYGLDMTEEMLALARRNAAEAGAGNVEFLKGQIEAIPLPAQAVEDRLSPADRAERGAWVGCIAGALSKGEYEAGLAAVGFVGVSVAFTHQVGDGLHSAIIKATKPTDTGQANGVSASAGHAVLPLASQPGCC